MPSPNFQNLQTRRTDNVLKLADRLARILAKEKGVPVARADAVAIAVREALERRKAEQ